MFVVVLVGHCLIIASSVCAPPLARQPLEFAHTQRLNIDVRTMTALNTPDRFRALSSPTLSDGSSLVSASTMPTPTTPTTTPNSSPSPSTNDATALVSFLAEVDEWLLRINERVAELETRHRKHLSMDSGWLRG
ncbi:hypothetical protein BJ912DRAFT_1141761 [Pholiota molesta]|nr:hypothetical protein BJ912DRAFT_1141761 [Pholiota molesta]